MRSILGAAIDEQADVTLVDMEAGLEHLSRSGGTLAYADVLLVIMEPSRKSILTAGRTIVLAEELGIPRSTAWGTRPRRATASSSKRCAPSTTSPWPASCPADADVIEADRRGELLAPGEGQAVRDEVTRIVDFVDHAPGPLVAGSHALAPASDRARAAVAGRLACPGRRPT